MKIQSIAIQTTVIPLKKPFKTALRTATEIENILVKVTLENGLAGLGGASPTLAITGDSKEGIVGVIKNILAPQLIGQDIRRINSLSRLIQSSCARNSSAKAAMEIALYDAFCKLIHIPLYLYLGGKSNELKNDMTVSVGSTTEMVEEAREIVKNGFHTLKIKAGKDWTHDFERICAIYEAVGPQIRIRIDANQGWSPKQAIEIIRRLEKENIQIEAVEQPVKAHDIEGLKLVKNSVNTPIMADESVFSPADALKLIYEKAVDFLNIKLMKTGGIRRAAQIADIAEAAGIECMIGSMMESPVSLAAAAHLAAAHPNITKMDLDAPLWLEEHEFAGIQYDREFVKLSDLPGLGIIEKQLNK